MLVHSIVVDCFVLVELIVLDRYLVQTHLLNFLLQFLLRQVLLLMLKLILFFIINKSSQEIILLNLCFNLCFRFAKLLLSNLLVPTVTSKKYLWVTGKLKTVRFLRPHDIKIYYYTVQITLEYFHHHLKTHYFFYFIVMML